MTKAHHIIASLCVLVGALASCAVPALAAEPEAPCPNEQLRAEQPFASALPDCRAYEMVSPLAKDDGGVTSTESRAAVSGEAVAYFGTGSFAEPEGALAENSYLSRRGAGGWVTQDITPPFPGELANVYGLAFKESLFTPELSRGVTESWWFPLVSGQPAGYVNLYVANTETGSYEAVTSIPPEAEYKPYQETDARHVPDAEGASSDLSHVVFQQLASLCCDASPQQVHIYEWADGSLRQVDVPPPGGKLEGTVNVGSAASGLPKGSGNPWRAVSEDGSRVIFTGAENNPKIIETAEESEGQVYVRENPMSVENCSVAGDACTVEISKSERSLEDPNAGKFRPPAAWYRDASADGSRVFFTSKVELTNDAYTGEKDNAANLYEYDFEKPEDERLTDLTVDETDPDGAAVLGLVTASEDGSYVYFVAEGKLTVTGEKNGEGEEPVAGKPNLYLSHAGSVTFIATLAADKHGEYLGTNANGDGDEEDWVGSEGLPNAVEPDFGPGSHSARVTPDGTELAFESELRLTKYNNQAAGPGECENERCREVYLYDAVSGSLVCVSCDPPSVSDPLGARPVGPSELGGHENEKSNPSVVGAATEPYYLPRNISEGGGRVFFQSDDALVPHDSNGRMNVYEWERPGVGSCTESSPGFSAAGGGCVFGISDVAGGSVSYFMDASASGNDVFIATGDQLLPSDTDTREDVYDVRVEGGFPVSVTSPECVNADSCKPPVSPQPGVFGVPASATFSGPGNPVPPPPGGRASSPVKPKTKTVKCKKSEVRKHNKCVRKKKPKAKKSTHTNRRPGR